ncbi:EEP domain-containing protein [Desulfoluna limicola]|uniref:EEP domain-containing protein n=1 Tax=Desulfoluna limicola TaxID=2810562 RepID=A0ABM7PKX1_9BACT|nr:endonuclease/exonuclease/phosphatase family protein [Desulfoluna limicola]BCS97761.1 EEP domain-containing protein [Desulfoluna limicola]
MKKRIHLILIAFSFQVFFIITACSPVQEAREAFPYPDEAPTLSPTFSVVTWNVAKAGKSSVGEITNFIEALSSDLPSPVIALQEATGEILDTLGRGAHFADSFHWWWSDTHSGVALLAPTAPIDARAIKVNRRELGCTTPKMGLAATYPISGHDAATQRLLVVTLHGLNFEISPTGLSAQMKKIHTLISEFHGPVVVCGDFNTWSAERLAVVTMALPDFKEVPVNGLRPGASQVVSFIGGDAQLPIDRIFYRGLVPAGPATAVPTPLSDHVPVMAQFSLP